MSSNGAHLRPILPIPYDQLSSLSKPQLMRVALKHSLSAGFFVDTKIYAFSRRRLDGTVDKPSPIYANSALLRANSSYFDSLFDAGFVEGRPTSLRGPFPEGRQNFTSEYDYDSDSDLEDEDTGHSDRGFGDARPSSSESLAIDEVFQHQSSMAVANQATGEQSGRLIVISDIAFSTLKAAIFYFCTGELNFAPLRSSSLVRPDTIAEAAWQPPPCSPKSMYRLADKLSLMDLKDAAMANFVSQLTTATIVQELRSSFTSLYDDIRNIVLDIACQPNYLPVVLAGMHGWLAELATGDFPREADFLAALIQKVATRPLPPTPSSTKLLRPTMPIASTSTSAVEPTLAVAAEPLRTPSPLISRAYARSSSTAANKVRCPVCNRYHRPSHVHFVMAQALANR